MNDIIEAVPIDKYFELFKPNAGGEGGYIRISMNFIKDLGAVKTGEGAGAGGVGHDALSILEGCEAGRPV